MSMVRCGQNVKKQVFTVVSNLWRACTIRNEMSPWNVTKSKSWSRGSVEK